MGSVTSKGDHHTTPLLNLCKERNEMIRGARDARYHLAKSHLLYFRSLLDFSTALTQFVHKDLVVVPFSSDDDSSSSELVCSESDSDSSSYSSSESDFLVCDGSESAPSSNQNPRKDQACGSRNSAGEGMEKPNEGLGFVEKDFSSSPVDDDKMRGSENSSSINRQNSFTGPDIFGLYEFGNNTQSFSIEPDLDESDETREIREREGIPDLEPENDDHNNSLVRKNQKKKKVKRSSSSTGKADKREMKLNVPESSSTATGKSDSEATPCNGGDQAAGEADESNESCAQETETTPEIGNEVRRSDEEVCDEACESSSSSSSSSSLESYGAGITDLRNIVGKINCISKEAVSYSEVSELLEVSKVVQHQPLGSQLKGFASRVLGSSVSSTRARALQARRGLREESLAVSLSVTLEKLCMWESKLYAEVTVEEKLRVLYDKWYQILKSLDQNGAESSDIYEAESVLKLQLSKINVSVRAVESVSMRIHKIRDEELSLQVIAVINGFKGMWRFLAKCHQKQFQTMARSKSCVHIVEERRSSRKGTHKVEEHIRRFRESLRGYIDAHRGFVRLLNEWLIRNITEGDETETEAPVIFRVCSEWLREIESVDEGKLLSAVEEIELRFRGLGFKQVEEEKQRMRTERLFKELDKKTKELEEIWGPKIFFPAGDSKPTAEVMMGPELLSLRESATQERQEHERIMFDLNDTVSKTVQECLVPVFEALADFCFSNLKAYENIRIDSTETP
ncbi:unnamed protein product [Thlaspi arvense]|uniref:Uncharacterized protein n=1 Tax=Thlaspi arvense TaxID=13288 RepID=A0AAU9SNG3_THLAR|nr:unnamed protein product [Thlaspi arvense]